MDGWISYALTVKHDRLDKLLMMMMMMMMMMMILMIWI